MIVRMWVVWALGWLVGLGAAMAGEPTGAPLLRLETGMHTARITRIATDAQGRWAVTASDDKTARIWSVATKQLEGVLRVPQDTGNEGKLFAVAMSPDGAQVAVAGWSADNDIYLFDRATQRLQRRIRGLPNVINHLAYSSDGRWLAASLGGQNGVRVFDPGSGQQVGSDTQYDQRSYSVEFSPKGSPGGLRLLSTSLDGQIRLHEVAATGRLALLKSAKPSGGQRPFAARFSPDGQRIAVGFEDTRAVQMFDAQTLGLVATLDTGGGTGGNFGSVAWSTDDRVLAAAGRTGNEDPKPVRRWSAGDWSRLGDVPVSDNTVMDLVALPKVAGGGWLFAGGDPTWGVLDAQAKVLRRQDAAQADLRGLRDQLRLSADGQQIRFAYLDGGKAPARFDLGRRTLTVDADGTGPQLQAARLEAPDLVVKDWKNTVTPSLNGQPIPLQQHENARSLAIAPNGQHFALGADWSLRYFDRTGKERWPQPVPVPGAVWALNISQDGRWVVAGYGDGTIRWHRVEDGREVLAFFPHADRQRWVLWTPEGFFDASPGAEDLIGYHVNRGKDREGEFIRAAQLRDSFYNPALVAARLTPDGDRLMAAAVKRLGNVTALLENARNLPPLVEVVGEGDTVSGEEEVEVTFRVTDRGGGVGAVRLYVNGRLVEGRQTGLADGATYTRKFPLPPGTYKIHATATSLGGVESAPTAPRTAILSGPQRSGTLHILAVGVESYQDPKLRLQHSAADAERLAAEIARRAEPVYPGRVAPPVVLRNEQATLAGIQAAFDRLSRRFQPEDTLVIFLAGHGEAAIGRYTFLPWDFKRGAPGAAGEGLSEALLLGMLQRSPANTLLLLDTCDAGGMVDMLEKSYLRLERRAIIGASRRGELAREGYKGHGVFTAGMLQVLNSSSGGGNDPRVLTPVDLLPSVRSAVQQISKDLGGGYQQRVDGLVGRPDFPLVQR